MPTRLLYLWDSLRTSYWLVPAMMSIAAAGLAVGMITIDHTVPENIADWWIYSGGADGARSVLSTIAGSMITVAGVVFSITIVALSLASGQFGPRLLRNFIRDRSNQSVLGTFTGTYIYCLLVLRTVVGEGKQAFVPGLAVAVGILLALASLGVLIHFIHHVAVTIQANKIIATVSQELHATIDRLWPDELGQDVIKDFEDAGRADLPDDFDSDARTVAACGSGYVAAIELERLLWLAQEKEIVIRLLRRPGHFVITGNPVAAVWPGDRLDDDLARQINGTFLFEVQRTPYQDVEFTFEQLVEVAVRALSPGINDPFTAMTCIDWLSEALGRLARRSMPSPYLYDDEGKLRVVTHNVSFADVADVAFNQIRQYGRTSAAVMIRMLDAVSAVGHVVRRPSDRIALERHAKLIRRGCEEGLPEPSDRMDAELRYAAVMEVLGVPVGDRPDPASGNGMLAAAAATH